MADDRYREHLFDCRHRASDSFDKAIMTLAASALGISLALIRGGAGRPALESTWCLAVAWGLLGLSVLAILVSFRTSHSSYDHALDQLGDQLDADRIFRERPGGGLSVATDVLNYVALACLVAGVGLLAAFVWLNIERLS